MGEQAGPRGLGPEEPAEQAESPAQPTPDKRRVGVVHGALFGTGLGGLVGLILAASGCSGGDPLGLCGAFQALIVLVGLLGGAILGAVIGAVARSRMSARAKLVLAASVLILATAGVVALTLPPRYPPCPTGTERASFLQNRYVYCLPSGLVDAYGDTHGTIISGASGALTFDPYLAPDAPQEPFFPLPRDDRQAWRAAIVAVGLTLSVLLVAWNLAMARRDRLRRE